MSELAPDWIRGITIKQPWTAAIVYGDKRVENRPRPWRPGWRLLHAGAEFDRVALHDPLVARTIYGRDLPTKAVLGIARITACHLDGEDPCSPWAQPGRHHLELDEVFALPQPVSCSGALGPWRVPLNVFTQVLSQLPYGHALAPAGA